LEIKHLTRKGNLTSYLKLIHLVQLARAY
jgi:hypothetical protein